MKCPNDSSEMIRGGIGNYGNLWIAEGLRTSLLRNFAGKNCIYAYRCPQCGKIELTTESEEKE